MGSEEGDGHGRGRPRDPDVDEAILQATVRTLRERGWGATTVEDVASEAGVSKASIYRRYRSKVALVADAATHDRQEHFPSFDTGSVTGDMMTFVLASHRRLIESVWHRVLPGVLGEAADDPDVREVVQEAWSWRRDALAAIVARGIARGEVHPDTDPNLVLSILDGATLFRLLVTGEALDYAFADKLVDQTTRAISGFWR